MADSIVQDVVNQSQSASDLSPADVAAITTTTEFPSVGDVNGVAQDSTKENGLDVPTVLPDLEDASAKSDTDTSRAEGSVAGDKPTDSKPIKKFAPAKPMSFAKYSVPKVVAANAAAKATDKAPTPTSTTPVSLSVGRPRLVAKTTASLQQSAKVFKPAAPDPMQVWNKNRVTPQASTKHLTDEELKQQYGIHLTSRLQADAEGKEAKWADIDDDEDDWAPETIEWNDGTKTTLTAAELAPVAPVPNMKPPSAGASAQTIPPQPQIPHFVSSVGPNATVLKIGANAEKQQAQKAAADKSRSPLDRPSRPSQSSGAPAPPPSKSPWAVLPPVDKASPIEINPQPMAPPNRFSNAYGMPQQPYQMNEPSPAKEISADDFNRTWRDGSSMQPRELYVPNSGRYEAVPEGRRRTSRNDQGFRAPAVLQRPMASDPHAPAEPSAAFQTTRTSSDATRRRASSIVSGGSGQFARRLSFKSGDMSAPVFDDRSVDSSVRPMSQEGPSMQPEMPPQQVHAPVPEDQHAAEPVYDLEVEREKQRQLMRERGVQARERRLAQEAQAEAEKKERIRKKLESLGAAQPRSAKVVEPASTEHQQAPRSDPQRSSEPVLEAPQMSTSMSQSPPRPPQPLATGEPQQYGMIKVHALDSTKKMGPEQHRPFAAMRPEFGPVREGPMSSPSSMRPGENQRPFSRDALASAEASPKLPKPASGSDARSGWGDHRAPAANLWGISSNKALGNGTFDQTLAGYAPQDLSRTPSGAPGWVGRSSVADQSPHISDASLSLVSPDQGPLAVDSEADTPFPRVPPAPIGRPPHQAPHFANGMQYPTSNGQHGLNAWNNFHQTAGAQERAESERIQREIAARREEEQRTGLRTGPQYTFNETWKQVQLGEQPTQRNLANKTQTSVPASSTAPGQQSNSQATRGSRFFPAAQNHPLADRRAVTYGYIDVPRSPSPPPAEEYASAHPAFDGNHARPAVRFPRERAVVKLPPMGPPTPPAEPEDLVPAIPTQPMTWAARAAMASQPQYRSVSTPLAQTPSWQERFNGLLGKKAAAAAAAQLAAAPSAVESSSRQEFDALGHEFLSVSLPAQETVTETDVGTTSKSVEEEEDLFEDRELASLPTISLPLRALVSMPLASKPSSIVPRGLDISSTDLFHLTGNGKVHKPQYVLVRTPEMEKTLKRDLLSKSSGPLHSVHKTRNTSGRSRGSGLRGGRGRGAAKVA